MLGVALLGVFMTHLARYDRGVIHELAVSCFPAFVARFQAPRSVALEHTNRAFLFCLAEAPAATLRAYRTASDHRSSSPDLGHRQFTVTTNAYSPLSASSSASTVK